MNQKGWGFESPSGPNIFCLKKFDTFTRTSAREFMNVVAHAHLIFQMLSLLKKYLYNQSQFLKTWDSKCLVLIAQMGKAFGMNPKVGGFPSDRIETLSVSKALTLSQEHRKWMWMKIVLTLTYPICFVFVPCVSGTYFIRYFTTLAGSPNGFPRGCKFMVVVPMVTNP